MKCCNHSNNCTALGRKCFEDWKNWGDLKWYTFQKFILPIGWYFYQALILVRVCNILSSVTKNKYLFMLKTAFCSTVTFNHNLILKILSISHYLYISTQSIHFKFSVKSWMPKWIFLNMPSILKFILICILHPSDASRNPGQVNWNMIDSVSKYQFINVNLTIETQSVQ